MKVKNIDAKSILTKSAVPENWFGIHYNINGYRGCQHRCIYCDSRSECYQIDEFDEELIVKRNAAQLLDEALTKKRKKVTLCNGSMSDPYIPAERHIRLTESILKVIIKHRYPFHIITKSDLILRDIELLREINQVFLTVSFTITTCDESIASKIEPFAPSPEKRLFALQTMAQNGIYTGVLFQPILPYVLDNEANIKELVYNVAQCGGKYIVPIFFVTMRKGQREYFLNKLDLAFPGLKQKYQETYQYMYTCNCERSKELFKYFQNQCKEKKIKFKMKDIMTFSKLNPYKQITLFDFLGE